MAVIDAHQHVWDLTRAQYSWLDRGSFPIDRTIDFEYLRPLLLDAGIGHTVLVQSADNRDDTDYMFDVAEHHHEVAGIVAWVPLDNPEAAASDLAQLRTNALFVGIRNLIHTRSDPDWLLRPDVDESLGLLERADVPFDVVAVLPRHLELVGEVSRRHPGLRMVIDHLAKPPIKELDAGSWRQWRTLLSRAAENPLVYAKVSGLYPSEGDLTDWHAGDVRPALDFALETFGADRLMYGGDWPISVLAGGYRKVWGELSTLFDQLPAHERDAILSGTATNFYGLRASVGDRLP
jgi:L-fucono-1,5-lactonase